MSTAVQGLVLHVVLWLSLQIATVLAGQQSFICISDASRRLFACMTTLFSALMGLACGKELCSSMLFAVLDLWQSIHGKNTYMFKHALKRTQMKHKLQRRSYYPYSTGQ